MGKKCDIPLEKIGEIKGLLRNTEYSQREIAKLVGVSHQTVMRIKKKIDNGEEFGSKRPPSKRKTTPRTDRIIRNICQENRRKPLKVLTKIIRDSGVHVSDRTIRRRLKEEGLTCHRPAKKPKLTAAMKKKRLDWARNYRHWSVEQWEKVCFSDESTFQVMMDKTAFVRRRPSEKFHPDCIVETVKHPPSVMIWSVICGQGTGRLYKVNGMMKQDQYRAVMENQLLPQMKDWSKNGERLIFMQDGAPCHTAKSVMAYLKQNKVEVLPWPGNSPDLNPIENIWELVKREIGKEIITTKQALIEKIIQIWHHNPELPETVKKSISSMPRRIEAVIASKGGFTKY